MKYILILVCALVMTSTTGAPKREYYEIKVYNLTSSIQEEKVERFLKDAYVPALHRAGISKVGVFKPVEADTVNFGKKIFVLIPYSSLDQFAKLSETLLKDKQLKPVVRNTLTPLSTIYPMSDSSQSCFMHFLVCLKWKFRNMPLRSTSGYTS